MRRRITALLLGGLLVATAAVFTSASPASANAVCAGTGTATLSAPLYYPAPWVYGTAGDVHVKLTGSPQVGFTFSFGGTGACVPGGAVTAGGVLLGWCGHSSGNGITTDGYRFTYVSAGSLLVITGGLVGIANAIPDVLGGESCATAATPGPPGGADNFQVSGAVAKIHCNVKGKSESIFLLIQLWLFSQFLSMGIHFDDSHGEIHLWFKVCVQTGVL